jgi:hypothetical protein
MMASSGGPAGRNCGEHTLPPNEQNFAPEETHFSTIPEREGAGETQYAVIALSEAKRGHH